MANPPTGSSRDVTPDIQLEWKFRFWDVRRDSESFGKATLTGGGYGKQGDPALSTVAVAGDSDTVDVPYGRETGIGMLTFDHAGETVDLSLKAPPAHLSAGPAGPDADSPKASAQWNNWVEVQMRDLVIPGLQLDEDGYVQVTGGRFLSGGEEIAVTGTFERERKKGVYDVFACQVAQADADDGLAHHGYAKVFARKRQKKGRPDLQRIEIDWLFDVFRPNATRKFLYGQKNYYRKKLFPKVEKKDLTDAQKKQIKAAEREDKDSKKSPWQDQRVYDRGRYTDPYLVIHVTGKSGMTSQLQQLTSWAAIHYMVCWNGHAVKVVEDEKGCYHAGWQTPAAGYRDYVFSGSHVANKTAIGIEHLAGGGADWPTEQENGSVRLIRAVVQHHDIPPCAVIRHRDLALDKPQAKDPSDGKMKPIAGEKYMHVVGKECPGMAVPWGRFQDEKLTLWPQGFLPDETAPQFPEGDDFFHGVFDLAGLTYLTDTLAPPLNTPDNLARQEAAIGELKGYLELIGYWVYNRKKKNEFIYDDFTTAAVTMCQERLMTFRGAPPAEPGKVDLQTARAIWAACQHGAPVLPPLQTR